MRQMLLQLRRAHFGRVLIALLLFSFFVLFMVGCDTETPQNTFAPTGEVARDQRNLFYLAMWPAIGVMILVELGLVVTLLRFRRRRVDQVPKQVHGNTGLEVAWTIAPALLLAVLTVPMMAALFKIGREPKSDDFVVEVSGSQWLWTFTYPGVKDAKGNPVVTLTDLHIPAGQEVRFDITSTDVIHSFAIPRIAGTLDAVPGEKHREWVKVDQPMTLASPSPDAPPGSIPPYNGECREFCGMGHATMVIRAHVDSAEDFAKWKGQVEAQGAPKPAGSATPAASPPPESASPTPSASP